jgi:dipeptidyl aminopeptidase/acylaminoacyl peptidase
MKRLLPLLLLLTACFVSPVPEQLSDEITPVTNIEKFPSTLSLEYFSTMKLEGTDFVLGDVLSSNADYTRHTVTYNSNGLNISGILNIPNGDGPFPLMVMNHGYIARSVYTNGRGLKREQDFFARNGYAVLHSDYRGHAFSDPSPLPDDTSIYDAGIEYSMDVVNGITALKNADISQIDTTKLFMLGHSLGGGVSMNIAVAYPDLLDGLILYAPVHIDAYENFYRWRDMRLEVDNVEKVIGSRESDAEFWDKISSLSMISNLKTPILLFQGTEDTDVPADWAEFLAEELRENDKQMEYLLYEGEKHEFINKFPAFMKKTLEFTDLLL